MICNTKKTVLLFFSALLMIGCLLSCQSNSVDQDARISYLEHAFDSIEYYSIHRSLNIDSICAASVTLINDSTAMQEVYDLLHEQVRNIDHHSFLLPPGQQQQLEEGHADFVPESFPFVGKMLDDGIAYVEIRGFMGVDSVSADNYVDSLQTLLNALYALHPSGWIIDLRANTGGNPYAMLAGIGPILGTGTKCYSLDFNGKRNDYYYKRWNEEDEEYEYMLLADSAHVFSDALPVSVLTGPETGSAGEVLVLAFMGNEATRILGEPTYGVSTGLTPCYLRDSACLYITSSIDYDRFGNAYGKEIQPEVLVHNPIELFELATTWILNKNL